MLHPGFFESQPMAEVEIAATLTFQGLWVFGDDRGRILDDVHSIWIKVWPHRLEQVSVDDVRRHLDGLVEGDQLCRYELGGGRFLHVISWDEHQKISHPTPSKLPPCPVHQPLEFKLWWKDDDTATDRWRKREKAGQRAKDSQEEIGSDSGVIPDGFSNDSGATPPQCSSVQVRSDQANFRSRSGDSGVHPKFARKSQMGSK